MDRDAIERSDFPVGRRGYDPSAVDAHLRRIADEFESLRGRAPVAPAGPAPLSIGTSEQVRSILEAAEASAAQLRAGAEQEASEHVARVQEAAGGMLARLDELRGELESLLEGLRGSAERLNDGLAHLQDQAGELTGGSEPEPATPEPEPSAAVNGGGDEAGARLIALNMALSGTPREETAAYLAEHFALADPGSLLDDVYERAGR